MPLVPEADPPAADRGAGRELARRGARGGGATVSGSAGAVIRSIALARSAAVGGVAGVGAVRVREGRFDEADAGGFEPRGALAELSAAVESLGDEASAAGVAAARVLCADAALRADVAGPRLAAEPATAALGGSVTVLSSETRGARSSGAEGASPDVSAPALAEGVPPARVALDGTELAGAELAAPELAGPELVAPELAGTELVAPELAGVESTRTALVGPASERPAVVDGGVATGDAAVVDGDGTSAGPPVPGPLFARPLFARPLFPEPLLPGPLFAGPPVPGPPFPWSPWSRPSCAGAGGLGGAFFAR